METKKLIKEAILEGPVTMLNSNLIHAAKKIGVKIDPMNSVGFLIKELLQKVDEVIRPAGFPKMYPDKDPLTVMKEALEVLSVVRLLAESLDIDLTDDVNEYELASHLTSRLYRQAQRLVDEL